MKLNPSRRDPILLRSRDGAFARFIILVGLAIMLAQAAEAFAVDPPSGGGDGETYGWCGAYIVLAEEAFGSLTCSFSINVTAASIDKDLFWDTQLEPIAGFEWDVDAVADSPSSGEANFSQHWDGTAILQAPDQPQKIATITLPRVGVWFFTATFTPSEPIGMGVGPPDTGFWDFKACLDPAGGAGDCVGLTPDPIP